MMGKSKRSSFMKERNHDKWVKNMKRQEPSPEAKGYSCSNCGAACSENNWEYHSMGEKRGVLCFYSIIHHSPQANSIRVGVSMLKGPTAEGTMNMSQELKVLSGVAVKVGYDEKPKNPSPSAPLRTTEEEQDTADTVRRKLEQPPRYSWLERDDEFGESSLVVEDLFDGIEQNENKVNSKVEQEKSQETNNNSASPTMAKREVDDVPRYSACCVEQLSVASGENCNGLNKHEQPIKTELTYSNQKNNDNDMNSHNTPEVTTIDDTLTQDVTTSGATNNDETNSTGNDDDDDDDDEDSNDEIDTADIAFFDNFRREKNVHYPPPDEEDKIYYCVQCVMQEGSDKVKNEVFNICREWAIEIDQPYTK